jgi:ATP-binding protein involved in chromosome partitioning
MSVFVCPHCGSESHIFSHGGARKVAESLDAPFLGEIPLVPVIRETSDAGIPIVAQSPQSPEAQAFIAIAENIAKSLAVPMRPPPRIVME